MNPNDFEQDEPGNFEFKLPANFIPEYKIVAPLQTSGLADYLERGGGILDKNSDGLVPAQVAVLAGNMAELRAIMDHPGYEYTNVGHETMALSRSGPEGEARLIEMDAILKEMHVGLPLDVKGPIIEIPSSDEGAIFDAVTAVNQDADLGVQAAAHSEVVADVADIVADVADAVADVADVVADVADIADIVAHKQSDGTDGATYQGSNNPVQPRQQPQGQQISPAQEAAKNEHMKQGVEQLVGGAGALIAGTAALVGAGLGGLGSAASSMAANLKGAKTPSEPTSAAIPIGGTAPEIPSQEPSISILPQISEYRVAQAEKAANSYEQAQEQFWASGGMPDVRKAIEERALSSGLSVADVMEKMKPNGEMADLHAKFLEGVAESSDAKNNKAVMDKALDSFVRQHGRGQEELLNPDNDNNDLTDGLKDRMEASKAKMLNQTGNVPAFEGEEQSHGEKLRAAMQKIMERLKEIANDFISMLRGGKNNDSTAEAADHAPTP